MSGLMSMFGGGASKQAEAAQIAQKRQEELANIAQQRQAEQLRGQQDATAEQTRMLGAPARGRRLLTFAGDDKSAKLGG